MEEKELEKFAGKSGVHKTIVRKYFDELEKAGIDWQLFDIDTLADEIRDFGQTGGRLEHIELRKRLGLPAVVEKRAEEEATEEEIEYQLGEKSGVKNLLRRIYKEPGLSKKQKEQLKEAIIGGAPEIATLIALYDGEEQDYARRFLREMVLSPTAQIRDLLKGDTLKIRSERGWIKEINDTPLEKAVRSIDFVEHLKDFDLMASQPGNGTTAVYKRKTPTLKPVKAEPSEPPVPIEKPVEAISEPPATKSEGVEEFVIPESRTATGGKPLTTKEYCYICGRPVKTDQYKAKINDHIVYFCSELCYYSHTHPRKVMPKYGIGQTVGAETVAELRKKPIRRISSYGLEPKPEEPPAPKVTTEELVESHLENVHKRAEELATAYSYGEIQKLGKENNIRLSGNKIKMLSELIRTNVL